jgi:tetratricopeptide (TPR) repeat protein
MAAVGCWRAPHHRRLTRTFLVACLAAAAICGAPADALAQDAHAQDAHAHDAHVHADGFGTVSFPISCAATAHKPFESAVAKLHSFAPAADEFTAIAKADRSCAIAWWGAAMSVRGNPLAGMLDAAALRRGRAFLRLAKAARAKTEREQAFIDALDVYYRDYGSGRHPARTRAYEAAMERLSRAYPDDPEASAFYALAILEAVDLTDKTYARQLKAATILEDLWARYPDHPGPAHYIIHAYDYAPIAERGLPAARRYASIAHASVHARHMPSHIFTMLGLWQESIAANEAAAQLIVATSPQAAAAEPAAIDVLNLHGLDFMVYARLQLAQDKRVADALRILRRSAKPFVLAEARYALERGDWSAAAALPRDSGWSVLDALARFARALGLARMGGRVAAARTEARALHAMREPIRRSESDYWAGQVDVYTRAADAWIALAASRPAQAQALMREAAELDDAREKHIDLENKLVPMRELYGELLLELGQPAEALAAFEASLKASPNRFRSYLGAARAAKALDRPDAARQWYAKIQELTATADTIRPEMLEARAFLDPARPAERGSAPAAPQ